MVDPASAASTDEQRTSQGSQGPLVPEGQDDPGPPDTRNNTQESAPIIVRLCRIIREQKLTDSIQAGCAIGLLVLAVVGYFYTVKPAFQRDVLQNQVDQLTKARDKYIDTNRSYVVRQFLLKVLSDAAKYKCGPTVWDLGGPSVNRPPPATGARLVEINLANEEFKLLDDDRRVSLIGVIDDFVKRRYTDPQVFNNELEIRHFTHLSGTMALADNTKNVFRFSQEESRKAEKAFQAFNGAMTALRVDLLPDDHSPAVTTRECIDLGFSP